MSAFASVSGRSSSRRETSRLAKTKATDVTWEGEGEEEWEHVEWEEGEGEATGEWVERDRLVAVEEATSEEQNFDF